MAILDENGGLGALELVTLLNESVNKVLINEGNGCTSVKECRKNLIDN